MLTLRHFTAVFLLFAACNGTEPCVDADGDGTCATVDCDDADASVSAADADQDGQSSCDGDCDDADPTRHTLDADGDGASLCDAEPDCDDTDAAFNLLDADQDGATTCDAIPDCDDADARRSPGLAEVCGDGIDNDCSGLEDDDDVDGDGQSSIACGGTDCDDRNPLVADGFAEACSDGLDNDCSGAADAADADACDCPDNDGDDYACDDVDDANPDCGADATDADRDGACADVDSDDRNANCGRIAVDTDGDGYCADIDVADNNANCFSTGIDEDNDGFCVETDIDDRNATCTTSEDTDNDGVCDEVDTDVSNPNCFTSATDADGDGHCVETDTDDSRPGCWDSLTDEDGDGACVESDCDDSAGVGGACFETCATWFGDNDGDGYRSTETAYTGCRPGPEWQQAVVVPDCDDDDALLHPGDLDGDGVTSCDPDPDCDDANPDVFPGATEVCDGIDNDCTSGIDDGFEDADGDGLDDCADGCPDDGPSRATSITFTYMGLACAFSSTCSAPSEAMSVSMPSLVVNGQTLGTLPPSALGCYTIQDERPLVSATYVLPDGLWNAVGNNAVAATGLPDTWRNGGCPGDEHIIQMTGWIQATLHFENGVADAPVCLYSGPGTECGEDYTRAGAGACGRPTYFFGGVSGNPSTSCREPSAVTFSPLLVDDDPDLDGVPAECDLCNADSSAFPGNPERCNNGIDDDCDGSTDAADADCCVGTATMVSEVGACGDGIDNDCDGLADALDDDCGGGTCQDARVLPGMVATPGGVEQTGVARTCDAGPAPGLCESDDTVAMQWLTVPVKDPDSLGWSLETCSNPATAVIATQGDCADSVCLAREFGCSTTSGMGDADVTLGIGTDADRCAVAYTLTLTSGGE